MLFVLVVAGKNTNTVMERFNNGVWEGRSPGPKSPFNKGDKRIKITDRFPFINGDGEGF